MIDDLSIGSRWRKIDFHVHTPASNDYREKDIVPQQWVEAASNAGLDAVVVADHNSGEWIDLVAAAANGLDRHLTIIPGCEITVDNGLSRIHLLTVFPIGTTSNELTAILGSVGITSGFGDSDGCHTSMSFQDITQRIERNGGIVIPAHVNGKRGLLQGLDTLNPELRGYLKGVRAVEACEKLEFVRHDDAGAIKHLAQVGGSDAHSLAEIGRHYSWIKTCELSIDALRIAFFDKENCILPDSEKDPNRTPDFYISAMTLSKFRTCGNDSRFPLSIPFSPHLTTIIGGRGTGKSTIVEALRIVFRRMSGLSVPEDIERRWEQFRANVLKQESAAACEFSFHGGRFRLNWRADAASDAVEEFKNGVWTPVQSGDIAQRFPIDIFSQRQVFALAENPKGLLELIDSAESVNKREWNERWRSCKRDYLRLCNMARELRDRRDKLRQLPPRIADLDKKIHTYEERGYGDILKRLQVFSRQKNLLAIEEGLLSDIAELQTIVGRLSIAEMTPDVFGAADSSSKDVVSRYASFKDGFDKKRESLTRTIGEISDSIDRFNSDIAHSQWHLSYLACQDEYRRLVEDSKTSEVPFDHAQYERWIAERAQFSSEVLKLPTVEAELLQVVNGIKSYKGRLEQLRDELYESRVRFVNRVVGDNPYVRMSVVKYGDVSAVEHDFREIFSLEGDRFVESVYSVDSHGGLLAELVEWEENGRPASDILNMLEKVKTTIWSIAHGARSGFQAAFDRRLQALYQEKPSTFNEASVYLPEDKLVVEYPVGGSFQAIEGGASAGQKSAAILAFLLSYGDDPIVIDQPEDDLDNSLIMNLVVKQLKANKKRRQMIVVTHNPNIVVNGDSELVDVMTFKKGQIHCDLHDGLESRRMRDEICRIMEGGIAAFKMRYKRIVKEGENV